MKSTILCVDDERVVLESLREALRRAVGPSVAIETAESASEALEILEELHQDGRQVPILISDQIMPGMKGDELLAVVAERWPRTRAILLTGQASTEAVGRAVNRGNLYRYFSKPWDGRDLGLTVIRGIESYNHQVELDVERATLERLYNVALDLSANLAADSRYRRLLASARSALDVEVAELWAVVEGKLERVAVDGHLAEGDGLQSDHGAIVSRSLAARSLVRENRAIAVPLLFEGVPTGSLVLCAKAVDAVSERRIAAFAALAAAAKRTAALVDALEDDATRQRQLARALQREARADIDGPLVGRSDVVAALRQRVQDVARGNRDVLLVGPAGSGREAAAHAIHRASERAQNAIMSFNCALQRAAGRSAFEVLDDAKETLIGLLRGGSLYLHNVQELGAEGPCRNYSIEDHQL